MRTDRALRADPRLAAKAAFWEGFWKGEGPCAILFAKPHLALGKNYARYDLREQHADPRKLLAEALDPALAAGDLPGDGIPVARADLGTTLFPSALGLPVAVDAELHPSLSERLPLPDYAARSGIARDFGSSGEIPTATAMYRLLLEGRETGLVPPWVMPYLPDNQGVFDLSHLAVGTELFYAFEDAPDLLLAAQERSLELFLAGSRYFKDLLGEDAGSMVHGHGMSSGVWFPDTGIRISEDSCTLISDDHIRRFCLPFIERAARPFGRAFLHFCGRHEGFLRMACESPLVSTLNLGNPESYDLGEVLGLCARTGTAYFGHVAKLEGEGDLAYIERLADLVRKTRCRVVLVAPDIADKAAAAGLWRRLTKELRP